MYDKHKAPTQLLLFADHPKLSELCALTVKLTKQTVLNATTLQPQILKCREIIFTEPNIIATPALDISNAFYIVMEQSLFKTGRLQARFQKIGLEASKPRVVTPSMFQDCLRYTLVARIAPNWNKTGEWLIQGREFLISSGYVNAVKLDVTVNQDEMFFCLDATTVRFQPLQMEHLDIYDQCYKEFMQNDIAEIDECAIRSPWSHVLPSMKKGKVVGILRTLPQNGPFKSYKELKRHWKNTYGYRLPESDDGVIYYQIHFRPLGGKLFTYPEVCLRASDIQRVPRVDPKPILLAFLQDVQSKMSNICGSPLHLQYKAKYPILEISQPRNLQASKPANLSNRPSNSKVIYRSKEDMDKLLSKPADCSLQQKRSSSYVIPEDGSTNELGPMTNTAPINHSNDVVQQQMENESTFSCVAQSAGTLKASSNVNIMSESAPKQSLPSKRIVPIFTSRKSNQSQASKPTNLSGIISHRTVPIFKAKKIDRTRIPHSKPAITSQQSSFMNNITSLTRNNAEYNISLLWNPTLSEMTGKQNRYSSTISEKETSISVPLLSKPTPVTYRSEAYQSGMTQKMSTTKNLLNQSSAMASAPSINNFEMLKRTPALPTPQTPGHSTSSITTGNQPVPDRTPDISNKRPRVQDNEDTPGAKKPRAKPQIQENLDVEMLGRSYQLNKANSATLAAWLKSKGMQYKTKDKKSDLMDKVKAVLGLTSEQ